MVVVYYVNTYYLDAAIETIQSIKDRVELHVLIEVAPESKETNIIKIENIKLFNLIETAEAVLGNKQWNELKKYFSGVASVHFVVYPFKRSFSPACLRASFMAGLFINRLKPDVIHFDSVSPRITGMFPLVMNKKLFITVHDPLPHTGEGSWKITAVEGLFFRVASGLFFYSAFARNQFSQHYPAIRAMLYLISFQPFTFIRQFFKDTETKGKHILFFGRILAYKGVDMLLDAIPAVLAKFPDEKFVIAGKPLNCSLNLQLVEQYKANIQLIPEHISTVELAGLIGNAKFIVCPYRDATQSGVLMTAYALGKVVVGSDVGAFPEYIHHDINGVLAKPDPVSIANAIIGALENEKYRYLEQNVMAERTDLVNKINEKSLLGAYAAV